MENFINYISTNISWLFEGLGTLIFIGIVRHFWGRDRTRQSNSSVSNTANGNHNIQAGGNIYMQQEKKN